MAINFLNTVAVDENVLFVDTVNDRVGIGTDSPEGNLEISDSTQATGATLSITNAHIGSWVTGDKIGSIDFRIDDTSTTQPVRAKIHAEGKTTGTYPSSSQLVFSTANVNTLYERMRIDSAGNVGIGTDSPDAKLHIEGNVLIDAYSQGEDNGLFFREGFLTIDQPSITVWDMSNAGASPDGLSINSNDGIRFRENGGEVARFKDGNLGIGTTSPNFNLQVGDGTEDSAIAAYYSDGTYTQINGYGLYMSRTASYIRPVTSTTQSLFVGASSQIWNAISNNANTHYFITGTNEHMRINSAGNVGIGTTSPYSKLHIDSNSGSAYTNGFRNGELRVANDNSSNIANQTSNIVLSATGWAGSTTGVAQLSVIQDGSNVSNGTFTIKVRDNGTHYEAFRIKHNGNVGIGTTSPSEKLDVVGNIKIQAALLSSQDNTDVDTGAEVVAQVAHATYTAAFFDFVVKKGTNVRSGTVYACHDGTNVEFTETSTNDLGDTSDVTLSVDISGTNMRLLATVTSDDWSVKSLIRAI